MKKHMKFHSINVLETRINRKRNFTRITQLSNSFSQEGIIIETKRMCLYGNEIKYVYQD